MIESRGFLRVISPGSSYLETVRERRIWGEQMVLGRKTRSVFIVGLWLVVVAVSLACQTTPEFDETPVLHRFGDIETTGPDEDEKKDWLPIIDEEPMGAGDIRRLNNCAEYPFEPAVRGPWDSLSSKELAEESSPMHHSTDHVVAVGQRATLAAHMGYDQGALSREWVRLFVGTCEKWSQKGTRRTDEGGGVHFPIDKRMPAGIYALVFQAVGDATMVRSQLWVVSTETEVVAIDINGAAFDAGTDPASADIEPVAGAAELSRWHTSQGRLVVYLSGSDNEQQADPDGRERWRRQLRDHGFAVGPVVDTYASASREHGGQVKSDNGWGEANNENANRSALPITTSVAAVYVQNGASADHFRDQGLRFDSEFYRDEYCRQADSDGGDDGDGGGRTGWESLITEMSDDDHRSSDDSDEDGPG